MRRPGRNLPWIRPVRLGRTRISSRLRRSAPSLRIASMKRVEFSPQLQSLIKATRRLADDNDVATVLVMAEQPYDFAEIRKYLRKVHLVVASEQPDVHLAAQEDEVDVIALLHEPQARQVQIQLAIRVDVVITMGLVRTSEHKIVPMPLLSRRRVSMQT